MALHVQGDDGSEPVAFAQGALPRPREETLSAAAICGLASSTPRMVQPVATLIGDSQSVTLPVAGQFLVEMSKLKTGVLNCQAKLKVPSQCFSVSPVLI